MVATQIRFSCSSLFGVSWSNLGSQMSKQWKSTCFDIQRLIRRSIILYMFHKEQTIHQGVVGKYTRTMGMYCYTHALDFHTFVGTVFSGGPSWESGICPLAHVGKTVAWRYGMKIRPKTPKTEGLVQMISLPQRVVFSGSMPICFAVYVTLYSYRIYGIGICLLYMEIIK